MPRAGDGGKIRIGSFLRAAWPGRAAAEVMKCLDGSYLEWFGHYGALPPHLHGYEDQVAAWTDAVQQVGGASSKAVKMRCWSLIMVEFIQGLICGRTMKSSPVSWVSTGT